MTCNDCIHREVCIVAEMTNVTPERCGHFENEELYKLCWIPVGERLPEIGDYVLCSIADNYSKHKIIISQYKREDFWSNGIIEAWMPLPKPFEPQERSEKE